MKRSTREHPCSRPDLIAKAIIQETPYQASDRIWKAIELTGRLIGGIFVAGIVTILVGFISIPIYPLVGITVDTKPTVTIYFGIVLAAISVLSGTLLTMVAASIAQRERVSLLREIVKGVIQEKLGPASHSN